MKFAKATKFHRKSGEGLGDVRQVCGALEARHYQHSGCRTSGARTMLGIDSQPSRAGLKFGYRPYGPRSDSSSIFEFPHRLVWAASLY